MANARWPNAVWTKKRKTVDLQGRVDEVPQVFYNDHWAKSLYIKKHPLYEEALVRGRIYDANGAKHPLDGTGLNMTGGMIVMNVASFKSYHRHVTGHKTTTDDEGNQRSYLEFNPEGMESY